MINSLKRWGFSILFCLAFLFFSIGLLTMAFGLLLGLASLSLSGGSPGNKLIGIYLIPITRYGMWCRGVASSMSRLLHTVVGDEARSGDRYGMFL